ncbi:peptide/nickel transport system ATP-binding protein [Hydrogenispora ethanolica]|uniref:Peptide/nickel transport system ATP-binding protein n=1 Tax=Hydrogenispora ethanolica TaxID=1082276 RepID=A0A4R1QVE5_HYDET|nr:ABC transporter ATP-binding protein [Hydrogenispora ethanolica]TCL54140.1 peptide/nickel transport system ATP-binding protein [Hydrogenispora ethanolica]
MMNHLLEVKDIRTSFFIEGKEIKAVDGVSLYLNPGEIIGIVGESGSGKSVTMLSVLQLVASPGKVIGGEVYLEGIDHNLLQYGAQSPEMRNIRGGKISMIFQEPMTSLNPVLTIGYQIQENIMLHLKLDKEAARKRTVEMLKMVNIPDAEARFGYYPQQFSGGMRQRIMIAMAMSSNPTVLIADEATTALDVTTQAQLLETLRDVAKKTNTAVVLVTHNLGIVARFAERIYVMYSGNVVETSDTKTIFKNPQHPYTRGLLKAIPRLDDAKDRILLPIDGIPLNPADRPQYCPFYSRCQYHKPFCQERPIPKLGEAGPGHEAACWLSQEEKDLRMAELSHETPKSAPSNAIKAELCLEVNNVRKYFPIYAGMMRKKVGDVKAIEGISFTVRKGETLGIVGESGCGKTTLARCIMRVYRPEEGEILFEGRDIAKLNDKQMASYRPKISMIFQDPFSSLDPRQTAGSVVGESLLIHKLVKNQVEYDRRVDELFRIVELDPALKDRMPHEFSGGQRQRIGIARAISCNPSLIICDEPISALDVSIQAQIINLLEDLKAKLGISYLFIAHDLAVVKHISDRILVMYLGRVVELADCLDLYDHPLHPYTQALLSAVPVADPEVEEKRERILLAGEVPSIANRPSGCAFHERCPKATERCFREVPQLKNAGNRHHVACFLYE